MPPMPQANTPSSVPAPVAVPVDLTPVAPTSSGGSRELVEPEPEDAPEYPLSPDAASVPSSSSSPAALGADPRGDGATTPELMRYREWWGQDIGDTPPRRDQDPAPASLYIQSRLCQEPCSAPGCRYSCAEHPDLRSSTGGHVHYCAVHRPMAPDARMRRSRLPRTVEAISAFGLGVINEE